MVDTVDMKPPSPWHPETDPVRLAVLGKAGEELGECTSAVLRCLIQGIGESDPVTKKPNREWLEDEIADVEAMIIHVKDLFALDRERIAARRIKKYLHKSEWFNMIKDGLCIPRSS